jgi:hypothetical protein
MDEKMIKVWSFYDAPQKYRDLSGHGGDEDWLAFVPECMKENYIGWMEEGTPFGRFNVEEHIVKGGVVRIGAHA